MPANRGLWPFQRSRAETDAALLVEAVSRAARQPALYGPGRAPDTLEGRLEMMLLHGALALIRLEREPALAPLAQAFIDQLFRRVDDGLREAAVGDTAVPKRMKKIAGDFYGRLNAYAPLLQDEARLAAALGRNVFGDEAAGAGRPLAQYSTAVAAALAGGSAVDMFNSAAWPAA
jgi:cytochrome b pre-mRNA-processing protein 3